MANEIKTITISKPYMKYTSSSNPFIASSDVIALNSNLIIWEDFVKRPKNKRIVYENHKAHMGQMMKGINKNHG